MGAQAAALLASGGPIGDVPARPGPDGADATGVLRLAPPASYDLEQVARGHGGVGLAPTAWDGRRLHLRLPDPVVVHPDLTVAWTGSAPDEATLRRVLCLDDDLEPLWAACDLVPRLTWVRAQGAGRVLRAPTVWQDLVGVLAGSRTSYRGTQAMVRSLVGGGPFPSPEQVLAHPVPSFWGHRSRWLQALAGAHLDGLDSERWLDPALPDDDVAAQARGLDGFGPFGVSQVLPLLGRPRPFVLDGWLAAQVPDPEVYAVMGRWAGSGMWLDVTGAWLRR